MKSSYIIFALAIVLLAGLIANHGCESAMAAGNREDEEGICAEYRKACKKLKNAGGRKFIGQIIQGLPQYRTICNRIYKVLCENPISG